MSNSAGLRASLHYVGGIILLKCSLFLPISVRLALLLCSFSLILCRVGVSERQRRREKTDICLTKSSEKATLFDPLPNALRPLSFGRSSVTLSRCGCTCVCVCVLNKSERQKKRKREEGSLQTMPCILPSSALLPSAVSSLSVPSLTCLFFTVLC